MDRPPRTPSPSKTAASAPAVVNPDPVSSTAEDVAPASGSGSRPAGDAEESRSPTRTPVPRPAEAGTLESNSQVGVMEAQNMLDEPADLLHAEERAVLEMLTSMSAPTPTQLPSNPSSPSLRAASLPGVLPSNTMPAPLSTPASVVAGHTADEGPDADDEVEVASLLAPTALGSATAVSYHSSDSSSAEQQSEESADTAFSRNLRALYRQHDPQNHQGAADAAGLDELGLPSTTRVVQLETADDPADFNHERTHNDDDFGLPSDYGYRAGFQTQPRMTFDVHTIEEVAEPSSSGASGTSRSELSVPPPRPPARIGQSPFGSVSVGSPLGSRFRTMLQQQRDREQQGLGLNAPGTSPLLPPPVSPSRSPAPGLHPLLTAQRSVSPLRSSSSTTFETPAQTPIPPHSGSPGPSSLSGSQPSSPSKVRQLSRFFESSVSGGSESDISASSGGRRALAAAGVIGGAMAAAATRDRDRMRDLEHSLARSPAGSPTRRQASQMTESLSHPTLGTRPDSPGARSPIFTASRSLGTFGPQVTTTTAPTTLQHPVARRGMPTRPSVRSIAKQFATMVDEGTASPHVGPPVPPKRDGEPPAQTGPGEPQYGEVNVGTFRQYNDIPEQAARSMGASLDNVSTQTPVDERPSTVRPGRIQTAQNFFEPASTLSNPSRMVTAGTTAGTSRDEENAFSVASDVIDHFGPLTPPAMSQVAFHFNRAGSILEPDDSASNRAVPSEIGTIRREPAPLAPLYAVSPEVADPSGNGQGVDSAGRGPHSTSGPSRFLTPLGSFREAQRASLHLPLSSSEPSLASVPREVPEGSQSASVTPTQLSQDRRALVPQDLNRELSVASHHSAATHKTRATATTHTSRNVAELLNYLEEQSRARQARDRYLEEQIRGFQETIAHLKAKRSDDSAPSEPSDSSGGQTMRTAPEDTPQPSEVGSGDGSGEAQKPQDELTAMQQKLDKVLQIVSTIQAGPTLQDDAARILGPATMSDLSSGGTQTFQTASAGIPSPPRSLSDGDDASGAFLTAQSTRASPTRPSLSGPPSWISGSTMLSNWTGKSERIPPKSWTSAMSQPGAPPNSEYAPSSLGGPPSESDVTIKPHVPAHSIVPSATTVRSAPSEITVDMEAEVRKRRAMRNTRAPAVYPENQQNGWYTPRAPDGTPLEKELPNVPGIRWTPGGQQMYRPPSILSSTAPSVPARREVATYTQEDFTFMPVEQIPMPTPQPDLEPDIELEPPPEIIMDNMPPPILDDYPESNRGSTVMSNASAEFKEVLRKLQEAEEARQQQQKQQADIARYLNELNAWLERDVMDRTKEWRALSSGVQQLSDDLNNVRSRPPVVQLSDPGRPDDDGKSSRPPRAESPTQPAALRPTTTVSLAPPIVAPQPYAGANWSNPDADRPESDSGQSRRSGRVWSAQDDDDKEKEPKKEGLLSRVASKTGKVLLGTAAVGAAGLIGNEVRKHIQNREDKEEKKEQAEKAQQRKDEQERQKREDKREEQARKDEAKDRKETIAAIAKEVKEDKKKDSGTSEAVGAIAVAELAKLASDKTGASSTTVVTPAGTITTGKGGAGGADAATLANAPTNPKGVFQTNLPRIDRVQPAFADPGEPPVSIKDAIKSAFRPGSAAASTPANVAVADAAEATKEAAKASKEAATAANTALNAGSGGSMKKNAKPSVEGDAGSAAPAATKAAPAVTMTPQPDGTVTVQATPAPGAKAAKGGAAAPAGSVLATPAPAGAAAAAPAAGAPAAKAADAGKAGDKKDPKNIVKEVAGGAALTVAVEEILKHLLKQQDDARKQQDDAKKAEASLKAAQAEADKKAKEAREKEKKEMVDALAAKVKEEQAKEAKAMDAKTAIEQLVANLNAQKAAEAKRQAEADAAIKKLADELLKLSAEQNQKAVAAVTAASKDSVQKSVKDHNDELTKVLSKEVKAMFEDVGKIRETKRNLELELADLFAIKARHLKDVAPPKAAAPAKKGEEPKKEEKKPEVKKDAPKAEEPKKEAKKPEPVKAPPLTAQLPDRLKYEPLSLNFGPRTAREGAAPPAAAAAPKADKPKDKDAKEGKAK